MRFDRTGLLGLVHDLYAAHKDNQTFLHARLGLGEDVLEPYKQTIDRWLWPDVLRKQDTSVIKAKQAISNYKKAVGEPAGLAELMVFYCEQAAGFCSDVGNEDEAYFAALVRIFEQALTVTNTLPPNVRGALVARLDRVPGSAKSSPMASVMIWISSFGSIRSAGTDHRQAMPRRASLLQREEPGFPIESAFVPDGSG